MGEWPRTEISVYGSELEAYSVETPGGRMQIRWDYEASATPSAQLTFFAEFLATAGVYESWVNSCPLGYTSGNASHKQDVLGTWFLSILAGHHRYVHITALRCDGVSPQILGMSNIVSQDSLRRALGRMSASRAGTGSDPSFWPVCKPRSTLRGDWTSTRLSRHCSASRGQL